MGSPAIASALTALGFSLNEGRAYCALLSGGPQTGYEVSQRAQVPRSAVYGALRRLVSVGAARSIAGSPERFVAAPPDALIDLLRKRFDQQTVALERAIEALEVTPEVPDAFSVRGYERVMEEAERLVRGAKSKLLVSGWPREFALLISSLRDASARGTTIFVFSHSALGPDVCGTHFSYGLEENAVEQFWKHRLVVVADDTRTLIGATERSDKDNAVISETPAIAEIATSQIALDITLLAQRHRWDNRELMSKLLGDRVGQHDAMLGRGEHAELGVEHRPR